MSFLNLYKFFNVPAIFLNTYYYSSPHRDSYIGSIVNGGKQKKNPPCGANEPFAFWSTIFLEINVSLP